jgi:2-polyprenyl-3-methyl-5-hydroxy-6-metoxy-1,4-benzoquinol methylase
MTKHPRTTIEKHRATLLQRLAAPETASRLAADPGSMVRLAKALVEGGEMIRAAELAAEARRLAPEDPEIERIALLVLERTVPDWHHLILADEARNAAFDAALRRAVVPGCRVLDIGAGSGLLALMAARAGAGEVVSCELNAAIAATATRIVARNGYADRIRIVARHSRDLEIGSDLAGPADIIVSETLANNLLGEDILETMEDVVGRLGHPATRVIPSHGCVRIALAWYGNLAFRQTGSVEGFDLSLMNGFSGRIALSPGNDALALRSAPEDLFSFDFGSGGPFTDQRAAVGLTSTGGTINGIVQWIRLTMDAEGAYENRPAPGASSCWSVMFQPLPSVMETQPGDRIAVRGGRDQTSVWMWVDASARETPISAGT